MFWLSKKIREFFTPEVLIFLRNLADQEEPSILYDDSQVELGYDSVTVELEYEGGIEIYDNKTFVSIYDYSIPPLGVVNFLLERYNLQKGINKVLKEEKKDLKRAKMVRNKFLKGGRQ